jgi:hypothetical protein
MHVTGWSTPTPAQEEEDTCMSQVGQHRPLRKRRRIHACHRLVNTEPCARGGGYMHVTGWSTPTPAQEEEDTCMSQVGQHRPLRNALATH